MSDFKVQGKLGLDGAGFFSTLNKAEGAVNSFGGMLAGAFSVGAIVAFSKSILDLAGHLNDVSSALALNVEFLQRFVNSARQSGGDLGDVEKFLFKANESRQAAVNNPEGTQASAFKTLGFSSDQVANATAQQFMEQIIKAFSDGATPQEMNALTEIGGKSAKKLVGGFKDGLDQATEVMTEDLVLQLDEIGDKFTSLATTLKTVFAPAILYVLDVVNGVVGSLKFAFEFYKGLFKGGSLDAARAAGNAELLRQAEQDKVAAVTTEKKRRARHETEATGPGLVPETKDKPAKEEIAKRYSDSLLSVGNFLGSGGGASLQSVAESHLQVSRDILAVLRSQSSSPSRGSLIVGI